MLKFNEFCSILYIIKRISKYVYPILSNDFSLDLPENSDILNDGILKSFISASRELATFNGAIHTIPNSRILIDALPLKESEASCRIENIVTSGDRIYKSIASKEGRDSIGVREVLGYRNAVSFANRAQLSIELLEKIDSSILGHEAHIRGPGEQVYLKDTAGNIVYTPPKGDDVRSLLKQLTNYLGDERIDPLIRMAAGHAAFETIHPFMDGNGRTGRILNCAVLCGTGLLEEPVIYMSDYLIQNRKEYYRQLRRVGEKRANWEQWMTFMFDCVRESATAANRMMSSISDLYDATYEHCKGKTYCTKELMDLLFSKVYCRISDLEEAGICERNTASKYLKAMEADGILTSEKVGRSVVFKHTALMDLLSM